MGTGYGTSGKRAGPKRPGIPRAFALSAARIFSGVTGISSTRTPTASYTALATAGGIGSSGP